MTSPISIMYRYLKLIAAFSAICFLCATADARTRIARRQIVRTTTIVYSDSIIKPDTISWLKKMIPPTVKLQPQQDEIVIPEPAKEKKTKIRTASVQRQTTDMKGVSIFGEPQVSVDRMYEFVRSRNDQFTRDIAEAYYNIGIRYGIRGDIALCQGILETGWFKFADGTAVRPEQHNYCGLGVTRGGMTGHAFDTVELGVTAQIQHLYAYACSSELPEGEKIIDPRFKLVVRGVAPTWEGLSNRWAANEKYAERIMALFSMMSAE